MAEKNEKYMKRVNRKQTTSSATTEIVRDADVGAHSLSLQSSLSPVYNLRPLHSPMYYLFFNISVYI